MSLFKKYLLFIIPIVGLLIINFIYFYPALQEKVIEQDDIMLGYAKGKEIRDYREEHNEEPLWTQAMFSGMPTFQISTRYPNNWLGVPAKFLSFIGGKMSNIYIIFTLMFGFYLLLISLNTNPWLSAVGAVAFAFSAFFIISFGAGHNAKVRTAAFIAPAVMGILLTYRGKYLIGFALTALFIGLSINSNHFQITYYMAILLLIIAIVELVFAYLEKGLNTYIKATAVLLLAGLTGVGPNISNLWSTYEYTQETIRGGSSELSMMKESEGGLTFDYAMNWSYGISETFNLIFADFTGGGMAQDYGNTETYHELQPRVVQSLTSRGTPRKQAQEQADQFISSMFYWGDQSLVNGGYYVGAVVFYLFVLGLFVIKGRIKWWVAIATIFAFMLAWGKHFRPLNELMYEYVPLYNKFRVPSMTFVIAFFTIPLLGFLGAGKILKGEYDKNTIAKKLLYSLYITGGLSLFFLILGGAFFDFSGPRDTQLEQQGIDLTLLKADRLSLLRSSTLKTLAFCAITFGLFWIFIKDRIKPTLLVVALGFVVIADQWSFVKQHVGSDDFVSKREYNASFAPSAADKRIMQDQDPHFRVYNTSAGLTSDSYTSYYHKSIGGYHGAKLIRYQDLIENQLSKGNINCFNMLNAKWFIVRDQQTGQDLAQLNQDACGNAWLINRISFVNGADAEIEALGDFDPKSTAIVDERFRGSVPESIQANQNSSIKLISTDPKHLTYEANIQGESEFAVFSEIYYEGGHRDWKTYMDGEEVSHVRVNYLLRGISIPKGFHKIEFKFHPKSYYTGESIALIFSILLTLALVASIYRYFRIQSRSKDHEIV